ncbi:MAG: alpha/beta hydrolase [Planctomycetes bacterium]|nr:alpha/beta hydrolase [Planctomycetota bacterium]
MIRSLLVAAVILLPRFSPAEEDLPKPISLWEKGKAPVGNGEFSDEDPTITVYRAPKPNGTAIVICPGGGYGGHAIQPEGHGIARWLNEHGITGVVLKYRLPKGRSGVPVSDGQRAIQMTRLHSKEWAVDSSKAGIMGFSAGGHLASTCATQFSTGDPKAKDPHERMSARPDFAILVYPVITMGTHTHGGSRRNLLGKEPSPELTKAFSSGLRVTAQTPPTFLAHAVDDKPVPPVNSELFHKALKAKKVKTKYLELPNGGHGLNGYKGPSWDAWQKQSLEWLAEIQAGK